MTTNKYLSFIKANIISFLKSSAISCLAALSFFIIDINAFHGFALTFSSAEFPPAVVKTVLSLGADIHANNDQALHIAASKGRLENVKVLLDHGAGGTDGDRALVSAITGGNVDIIKTVIDRLNIKFKCSMPWIVLANGSGNEESAKFITDRLKDVPYECPSKESKGSE